MQLVLHDHVQDRTGDCRQLAETGAKVSAALILGEFLASLLRMIPQNTCFLLRPMGNSNLRKPLLREAFPHMNLSSLWHMLKKASRPAKMKDSIMISLLGGLIGTTVMDMSNLFLWRNKKSELLLGHLAGSMFMRPFMTKRRKNFLLGQIFHMLTGVALGIPIFQLLKTTGKDHHIIKGAFAGLAVWGVLYNFGQRVGLFMAKPHLTKTHYASLWHNLLYGVSTAQAIVSLSDPSVFREHDKPTRAQNTLRKQTTGPWADLPPWENTADPAMQFWTDSESRTGPS